MTTGIVYFSCLVESGNDSKCENMHWPPLQSGTPCRMRTRAGEGGDKTTCTNTHSLDYNGFSHISSTSSHSCFNVYTSPTPPCIPGDTMALCQCVH